MQELEQLKARIMELGSKISETEKLLDNASASQRKRYMAVINDLKDTLKSNMLLLGIVEEKGVERVYH